MESKIASTLTIWLIWYEDRFAMGSDRDPASVVDFCFTERAADEFILSREGYIDVASGKFDGLFMQEWNALKAIEAKLIKEDAVLARL